jgi:hypothetical protein
VTVGVTYRVTPTNGDPWTFTANLAHEVAWESYARKHGWPITPTRETLEAWPLNTNGGVLAWAAAGRPGTLEDYLNTLASVLPLDDDPAELPDPTVPAPGPGT